MCIFQQPSQQKAKRNQFCKSDFLIWLYFDYLSHWNMLSTMKLILLRATESITQSSQWRSCKQRCEIWKLVSSRPQLWRSHLISVHCQIRQALSLCVTIRASTLAHYKAQRWTTIKTATAGILIMHCNCINVWKGGTKKVDISFFALT